TNSTSLIVRRVFGAALLLFCSATSAWSQVVPPRDVFEPRGNVQQLPPRPTKSIELSGPRFGLTLLSQGNVDALKERDINVRPMVSQFGWQIEKRLYTNTDGLTALTEFVPLISGLEQGVVLPSLNWLVGVRSPAGVEFGIGPNITPVGVGLVIAGGVTVRSGAMNIPLNFA